MELEEIEKNNDEIEELRKNIQGIKTKNAKKVFKIIDFFDDHRKDFDLGNRYIKWNKIGEYLEYKEKLLSNSRIYILKYKKQEVYRGTFEQIKFIDLENELWLTELISQYYKHFNFLSKELNKLESYQQQIKDSLDIDSILS